MSKAPSNFRQQDVARAIKAAKSSGLDIVRVEIDPKTAKITLIAKRDDEQPPQEQAADNPWHTATHEWTKPKRRKR